MKERIGFIGVRHMGTPLVERMLRAGYDVMMHDVREEAVAHFRSKDVKVAERSLNWWLVSTS